MIIDSAGRSGQPTRSVRSRDREAAAVPRAMPFGAAAVPATPALPRFGSDGHKPQNMATAVGDRSIDRIIWAVNRWSRGRPLAKSAKFARKTRAESKDSSIRSVPFSLAQLSGKVQEGGGRPDRR